MSGAPRVRSMNAAELESRPVLGPTGTRQHERLLQSNLSLNTSCSSDGSTDSFQSRASTGRLICSISGGSRRNPQISKQRSVVSDSGLDLRLDSPPPIGAQIKKCAWVTPNTDPLYATFHDEEWGIPVHDDKYIIMRIFTPVHTDEILTALTNLLSTTSVVCRKLFELLVLSGALSEFAWSSILSKRHIFREVFMDFDPTVVSKLNEKKIVAPGSVASSLLSELKLLSIIENACQISKVPVKTPMADVISKDLVRRGFRSVGPTVVYSFMQVAGITNDHLVGCFRFKQCLLASERKDKNVVKDRVEDNKGDDIVASELSGAIEESSISEEL